MPSRIPEESYLRVLSEYLYDFNASLVVYELNSTKFLEYRKNHCFITMFQLAIFSIFGANHALKAKDITKAEKQTN